MPKQPADRLSEAIALHNAGKIAEAEAVYEDVLQGEPRQSDVLAVLGAIKMEKGDLEAAARLIGLSLEIKPDQPLACNNRGIALHKLKRHKEALASYDRAIALKPDFADVHNNRANALRSLRRYDDALADYDRALALKPDFAEAHYNRGLVLQELRRNDEALASYDRADALKPDYADAYWSKSFVKLLTGDYAGGWPLYEWRWKRADYLAPRRDFRQPVWNGVDDLNGKTILLYAEQGLGDTIHFCRYAQRVAEFGTNVVLEVQPALKSLMTSLAGVRQVIAQGDTLPAFDYHCPLLSLPLAFKTGTNDIPADIPYLKAHENLIARWADVLGERRRPRIGLVWAGNPQQINDYNRSMPLLNLLPLTRSNVEFVSLQKDAGAADQILLASMPAIRNLGPHLDDFADTAAVLSLMDIVLSVDTSVAHLAGALGRPLWLPVSYIACWRWMLDRDDNPWYPTARLFRQPAAGDWESVVEAIAKEPPFGGKP